MMRRRVVFMGTPDFAVPCLEAIVAAGYEVCGVVSQPDRPKGRGKKLAPSPVKAAALAMGLEVVTVERVKDPAFLVQLQAWKPDTGLEHSAWAEFFCDNQSSTRLNRGSGRAGSLSRRGPPYGEP